MELLFITLNPPTITLEARDLKLTPKWVYLIALAALRVVDQNPECSLDDVVALRYWGKTSLKSAQTGFLRFYNAHPNLLEPMHGAISKAFRLHSNLEVGFQEPLEIVREKLYVRRQTLVYVDENSTVVSALLAVAVLHIERGNFEAANRALQDASASKPSSDQKLIVLIWLARMQELQTRYKQALQTLQQLKTEIELQESTQRTRLNPARKAMLYIQTARLHLRKNQTQLAKSNYLQAKSYLQASDHRENGALENGLGRVAQAADDLETAFKHYQTAAEHFSSANLMYGLQAALNDLGVVCRLRALKCETSQPERAKHWYQKALNHFELCAQLCSAGQLGDDSAVVEVNLAHVHRKLGNLAQARIWLERAEKLARAAGNDHDLAYALLERGDHETEVLDVANAKKSFCAALEIFEKLENLEMRKILEKRVLDLRI